MVRFPFSPSDFLFAFSDVNVWEMFACKEYTHQIYLKFYLFWNDLLLALKDVRAKIF